MDFRQINKLLQKEYAKKRTVAEKRAFRNRAWVNTIPAYFRLSQIERELALEIAKQKIQENSCKELQKTMSIVRAKKKKILANIGLKEDDLEVKYSCDKCKDTGMIGDQMCSCFRKRRNEELSKAFGKEISSQKTFKNFNTKICKKF